MISQEEHKFLLKSETSQRILFGSRLYGTATSKSDHDYLCFYYSDTFDLSLNRIYKINHQFQYKDQQNNVDYIWTDLNQFYRNLWTGDSIINADIMLFSDYNRHFHTTDYDTVLEKLRNYKVIKAYLGFAKRDLKQYKEGRHKLVHATRCLYIAESLLENIMPSLNEIQQLYYQSGAEVNTIHTLNHYEEQLRIKLNQLHDNNLIKTYYVQENTVDNTRDALYNKLLNSLNTKQFKYD
jgi:hypothetical protein